MSGRAVARGVVMAVAAGLMLGAAAQANEAAHKALQRGFGELGWQQHGHPACLLHRFEIGGIDVRALGRLADGDGCGHADQWFARHNDMLGYAA